MCAPPDSGHIHMVIAASTLLGREHDLRQFECNVTHQAAQVTQKYVPRMQICGDVFGATDPPKQNTMSL